MTCSAAGFDGLLWLLIHEVQPALKAHTDLSGMPVAGINKQSHLAVIVGRLSEGKEAVGVRFSPQHDL